ncbi:MAG: hypothetical protein WC313_04555, partial [Candidatus Kapaibacterium sp.]
SVNLSAQTKQPGQKKLNYLGSNIFLDQHQDFKQSNFVIGWHWGSMKVLSRALLMNQGDISTTKEFSFYSEGDFNTNTNYFVRAYYDTVIDGQPKEGYLYSHCLYDNFIVFTNGMTYDPTLYLNPTNLFELNKRLGDSQNPIFGFLNKRGRVLIDSSDENYSRLIIDGDSLINEVVLSEPWLSNQLNFLLLSSSFKI